MKNYFYKTERIGFTTWSHEDIQLAQKLWGDSEVTKLICASGSFSIEQVINRLDNEINQYNEFGVQYYPIFLIENNDFVGCCGLRPYNMEDEIYEFGIHLCKDYWDRGLAFEASKGIIEYTNKELKINKFFAGHNPNNTASRGLLIKIGFKYTHDEIYEPTGLNHPSYRLDIK